MIDEAKFSDRIAANSILCGQNPHNRIFRPDRISAKRANTVRIRKTKFSNDLLQQLALEFYGGNRSFDTLCEK